MHLPLFLHVLGAMLLVGFLFAVVFATLLGRRSPERAPGLARFGLKTLLLGVLPSWILMRVAAQWTESEANYPDDFEPTWLEIGYATAEAGGLLILISAVLAGVGLRRGSVRLARIVGVVSVILLAAFLVAVWAMTAKPV